MFVDVRSLEANTRFDCDVCIMGAGAAGITMALELSNASLQVCVLESGGFEYEDDTQALYSGRNIDHKYPDLDVSRLRMFGGTTNHWAGACKPLDHLDFQTRPWVAHSGWPFNRSHLESFYRRAHRYCQLGPFNYDSNLIGQALNFPRLSTNPDKITSNVLQISPPTNFGTEYRSKLSLSKTVKVLLHANVTEIQVSDSGNKVPRVKGAVLNGSHFVVVARYFVLALGGIENARLLLVSDQVHASGLGNQNDLVGRFFMAHPSIEGAIFRPSRALDTRFYRAFAMGDARMSGHLAVGTRALEINELLNVKFALIPSSRYHLSDGIASYHALRRGIEDGDLPENLWDHIGNIASDLDMVTEAVSRRILGIKIFDSAEQVDGFAIDAMMEQRPNPDSRVTLSDDRDELGVRRVKLDWRFTDYDRDNVLKCYRLLATEIGRLGIGRLWIKEGDRFDRQFEELMGFGHHHMGTTRIHPDARYGVVDADLKLHGISNFFVVGSSVFPTGGHIPPTLTIVALAIRLADHLKMVARKTE